MLDAWAWEAWQKARAEAARAEQERQREVEEEERRKALVCEMVLSCFTVSNFIQMWGVTTPPSCLYIHRESRSQF